MNIKTCGLTALLLLQSLSLSAEPAKGEPSEQNWDVNNPPGEAYQAAINVTEGTWMNLSVSPDGKTLLFDLLGDLYSLPVEGGRATALTHSIAWEMQPVFSPDGAQIAFTSDAGGGDNIWIMNADGSDPRQVTDEPFRLLNSPSWSPDGQYIVARKHFTSRRSIGAGEIWLYHTAGGEGLQLNERPNDEKDLGEPAFSVDGRKVYFSRDSTPGKTFEYSKDSNKVIYEIFSVDREDGKIRKEVSGFGGSVRPSPSPDGRYLAFVRRIRNQSSIFLKDLSSGREFPIYQNLDRDMQETWAIHGVYPTIAWTPDSQNLVFWAGGKIRKLNRTTQIASQIPFKVETSKSMRRAVRFQHDPLTEQFTTQMLRWVTVSPDGKRAVFQALGKLYSRDLPDGKPKRLTRSDNDFEFYPAFSADSDWIVYTTWNDDKQGAIKKVRARGGSSKTLSQQPGKYLSPRFSPDGESIVYQKLDAGPLFDPDYNLNPGIYRMEEDGDRPRRISEQGEAPFFSADGQRIYFTDYQDKQTQLKSVNLQGHDPLIHASAKFATEFSLSPDERFLTFRERYQIYLIPFTSASKPIELSPKASHLPILNLSQAGGLNVSWEKDSRRVHWSLGDTLHSLTLPPVEDWDQSATKRAVEQSELGFRVEADNPRGYTLLSGAQIITMQGDKVIPSGDVLIHDNRIEAVGPSGSFKVPDNAKRINLPGKTIIPGLIDVHWHGRQGQDQLTPQQNWYNLATLAFGVTTLHDPSNNTQEIFAAAELAKAGKIIAPRIFSTGTILYGAESYSTARIESLEDARKHLQRLKSQGAFSVKSYNQPRRDQRQQILQAARESEMMVMPEGGSTLQHNLSMIVDGHTGIEHAIPAARIYDDVKQLWSQSGTGYTPTLVVAFGGIWGENYWYQHSDVWRHPLLKKYVPQTVLYPRSIRRTMAPKEDYNHFNTASVAAQLQDSGVSVQLGAHGQREGLGAHWEMWMFAQGGMKPLEVIRAATLDGARYLGMEQHIGSIEAGKAADLVVIDADILKDIYQSDQVSLVMLNGRLYDANSMNEIGNHPKTRDKLYFE